MTTIKPGGTLELNEPHPMAQDAFHWIVENYTNSELYLQLEVLSSCAISNNRLAKICAETLRRILNIEAVSDRYLLGLAWYLRKTKMPD